jgi:hypothetical protein
MHVTAYLSKSLFLPKSTYYRHMMSLLGTNYASAYPPSWLLLPSVQINLLQSSIFIHVHIIYSRHHNGPRLLEKATGSQLVKKCPTFYGTRRFITALTRSRHLSLS